MSAPYGEEGTVVSFGGGLFTSDLPSAIPDTYCAQCDNAVATGTSIENRFAFKKSTIAFSEINKVSDDLPSFTYFGPTRNPDNPVLIWGQRRAASSVSNPAAYYRTHFVREGSPYEVITGNGYFSITSSSLFIGAVNYNNVVYAFYTDRVLKITDFDWAAPSITSSVVSSTPSIMQAQPIHFFDRFWTASGNKLYFTDAVSSPGGFPETWNTSANFISVVGTNGPGKIFKIISVGSRIYLFTSAGLFSLTITGSPKDWYLRLLDDKAIVNSYECAFEVGGLIYYTTIYGAFVTNGSDSIKLSGSIENYFLVGNFDSGNVKAKKSNVFRINYLDGGIVLSITSLTTSDPGGKIAFDSERSINFYSRIGSIAWSKWEYDTEPGDTKLIGVAASADSVLSFINTSPLSYCMVLNSWSTKLNPGVAQRELMVYDGLRDEWTNPGWDNDSTPPTPAVTQKNIVLRVASKFFGGGKLLNIKQNKYAFLEAYVLDPTILSETGKWRYDWFTEADSIPFENDSISTSGLTEVSSLGEFLLVKLRASFYYRIAQFYFEFDTDNSETIKIKDLHIREDTLSDGPNFLQ